MVTLGLRVEIIPHPPILFIRKSLIASSTSNSILFYTMNKTR